MADPPPMPDAGSAASAVVEAGVLLAIRGVERTFLMGEVEVPVLRGVDLDVPAARMIVLLGPSGSGKTTLLNIIGGIDRPDAGTVTVDGIDLAAADERTLVAWRRASVGFVFQFYNLVPSLTALENVQVAADLVRDPLDPADALERVGLGHRLDHFPAQLSGGEQQRVAIARALVKRPRLMLCDEPTGALDLETGRSVLALLRQTTHTMGVAVVIVTHNRAIADAADRVVVMGSGRIESVRDVASPIDPSEVVW